jgi:hypothetical protein
MIDQGIMAVLYTIMEFISRYETVKITYAYIENIGYQDFIRQQVINYMKLAGKLAEAYILGGVIWGKGVQYFLSHATIF